MQATAEKRWYLVQCKPRQDFRALEHLQHQGYECLLPKHPIERLRNGQWQVQEEPLFPGYLFIELDTLQDNWMPIRSTRGVRQIVRFGGNPLPVPDCVIQIILARASEPAFPAFRFGDLVKIDIKTDTEIDAIFQSKDGVNRVILLLTFLKRNFQISVPLSRIKTVDK